MRDRTLETPDDRSRFRLIVIGPTPPPVHGVAVFTTSVVRAVSSLGFLAAHLDTRDPRPVWTLGALDWTNVVLGLRHAVELGRLLRRHRDAAVYLPLSQGRWGFLRDSVFVVMGRAAGRRVYGHLNGGYFHHFYAESGVLMRAIIRVVVRSTTEVWVVAPSLRRCFSGLVPAQRVRVVENVADEPVAERRSPAAALPDAAGLPDHGDDSPFRILFLSKLVASKGCFDLLEAVALLGDRARGWHIRLVGAIESDTRAAIERRIALLPAGVRAEIGGIAMGPAKAAELAWADAYCLPTHYPLEGQPIALLEAMAASTAIVSTRHAGIPETVRHGLEALLVTPGDIRGLAEALESLDSDADLRQRLASRARTRYEERHRPERLRTDLEAIFDPNQ